MRALISWGFGVAIALGALHAQAQCTTDTDCKHERVCDEGKCMAPTAPPANDANGWGTPPPADADAAPSSAAPSPAPVASASNGASRAAQPARATHAEPKPDVRERVMRPRSTPLMVAGVVAVVASVFTFYGGYAVAISGCGHTDLDCDESGKAALGLTVASVVLVGVGIPMIVIGAKRVPAEPQPPSPLALPEGAAGALIPFVTPDSAGLRLRLSL